MSTSVTSVTNHFPSAENGFSTTTSASVSSGATTVQLNSVAGYDNGEVVVFVIDPTDATKKQTFTGIVDTAGTQITSVVWTAGSNQSHALGATVVDYATATHISMISKGLSVSLNQDGTLKTDSVTTANITDSNVTTAKIADNAITNAKLSNSAGEIGAAWQDYTPTYSNLTVGSGTVVAKYIQIGKTVHGFFRFVYGSGSSVGDVRVSMPVTPAISDRVMIGSALLEDASSTDYVGILWTESGTDFRVLINNVASTYPSVAAISSTVPFTWTTSDVIAFYFTYEAA